MNHYNTFFFCNSHHECDCILFNDSFHSNSPQAVHNWRRHSTKRTRQVRETLTGFCCRVWDEEMTVACFYLNALLPWHTVISLQHEPSINFTPKVEYVVALKTEKRGAEVAKETYCIWLAHVAAETCVGPSIEQILRVWTASCGSSWTAPQRTGRDPLGGSERCRDFGP